MTDNLSALKFTIIIPTRERSDVLEATIKTVLAQDYQNFEIIISDNFSCDNTESIAANFKSDKIKYINTGKRVGMSQNWEFALNHVTDGWVTIIGDDDGLLPGALTKVARIITETGTQAIRSATCSYGWPGLSGAVYGRLGVPAKSGWVKRNSKKWTGRVMMGKSTYTHLPVLYNGGFVDFDVLKTIKEKSGAYFLSMIPDAYMGFAIASVNPDYIYSFEPFAINGASRHSGGTSSFSINGKSKISPADKFYSEPNIPFHEALPLTGNGKPVMSIHAMTYESYLQSKQLRETSEFEDHQYQLALILALNNGIHQESVEAWAYTFSGLHNLDFGRAQTYAKYFYLPFKIFKLLRRIGERMNIFVIIGSKYHLKDVYEASVAAAKIRNEKQTRIGNAFRQVGQVMGRYKFFDR
jgi:glycosyltransferase involved in cell wall biosynthesis